MKLYLKTIVMIIFTMLMNPVINEVGAQIIYSCNNKYDADIKVYVCENKYDADLLVYKVENKYDAVENKGLWYFCENKYDAKKIIYFVENKYDADLIVCFVENKYDAQWRNMSKKHLIY